MTKTEQEFINEVRKTRGPLAHVNPREVPFVEISNKDVLCEDPMVSIICLTYNHAKYIEKTFHGFAEQVADFPFEIIIGEDCSTDNTLELCKKFQSEHPDKVRLLTWEKNLGSRANGLRCRNACRGKYMAFCEGDDYWCYPEKLKEQVEYLESHPDCGIVYGNARVVTPKDGKCIRMEYSEESEKRIATRNPAVKDVLLSRHLFNTSTTLIRHDILKTLHASYPEIYCEERFIGDMQIWCGIISMAKSHYLANIFSTYQISENSVSRAKSPIKQLMFICDLLEIRFKLNSIFCNDDKEVIDIEIFARAKQMIHSAYKTKHWDLLKSIFKLYKENSYRYGFPNNLLLYCGVNGIPMIFPLAIKRIHRIVTNLFRGGKKRK